MLHPNNWALALLRPTTPQHRLESYAMFVHAPEIYMCLRMFLLFVLNMFRQFMFQCRLKPCISFVMAWAGNLKRKAKSFEVLSSSLNVNASPDLLTYPVRHLSACPESAIRRSGIKRLLE